MFKYISDILKNFSPAQRIIALLILVSTIIIITLGTNLINSNTDTCDELKIRIKSQSEQITELNGRVNDLTSELLNGQKECTSNLISKQKEIMDIINGMIGDAERENDFEMSRKTNMMMIKPPNDSVVRTKVVMVKDNTDVITKLKLMKNQLEKKFINKK